MVDLNIVIGGQVNVNRLIIEDNTTKTIVLIEQTAIDITPSNKRNDEQKKFVRKIFE